jgi:hypothetical protein
MSRKKYLALLFASVFVTGFVSACASGPAADEELLGEEEEQAPLEAQGQPKTPSPTVAAPDPNAGLLYFFANGDKGLEVTKIDWDKPLSSENPGADCELRSRTPGVFACVVRQGKDAIVLTIHEGQGPQGQKLVKLTLDGKTNATKERWITGLKTHGYKFVNEKPGRTLSRQSFQSLHSHVDVIWVPAKQAVTLIFRAAPAPVSKPATPAGSAR